MIVPPFSEGQDMKSGRNIEVSMVHKALRPVFHKQHNIQGAKKTHTHLFRAKSFQATR